MSQDQSITLPRAELEQVLEALESSRVFVTTREKIKHPEGTDWYDERIAFLRARLAQPEQRPEPVAWRPIETAPKDNKRPLYLARFVDGELVEIDFDGAWKFWQESWEMPHVQGWDWVSARGIEDPTHWAYQDEPPPLQPEQRPEPMTPHRAWFCKVGVLGELSLPQGADAPMRHAIRQAFKQITGKDDDFCFSGWGGQLEECEMAVVENRAPRASPPPRQELSKEEIDACSAEAADMTDDPDEWEYKFARVLERKLRG